AAYDRLDRASKRSAPLWRYYLLPEGNRLRPGRVGDLQGQDAANADAFVGLEDRLEMLLVEWVDSGEVLHGRHPASQAFERADKGACADFGRAAFGIARRKRAQQPEFKRDRLEAALEQNVVRVVVRVDEPRHQKLVGRVDRLIDGARSELGDALAALDRCGDSRTRGSDDAVDDQEIGDRRQMHIAVVVVDPTVLDEDDAAGCRCGHRGTLSGRRRWGGGGALPGTASGLLYLRLSPMSADAATKSWTVSVQNSAESLESDFLRRHF